MDYKDIAEIRIRARSFLYEEYNNRRVFLKSYPLHCGDEEQNTRQPLKRWSAPLTRGVNAHMALIQLKFHLYCLHLAIVRQAPSGGSSVLYSDTRTHYHAKT
ncbi:hypothetical protein NC652_021871 [Populus alba x Populus x berolinensis]|uniref:Uncharacterized protein n=1 Tax=Populus alba x Populus x berolinensis TaxID=444605 RepID=A0AAD6QEZ1_9ROSI|nr:hypothetical protein NC652_021871 [Populus alba x Populus x berolinensis]KAJ6988778.1 hypothetical protein NC653_021639 [Populus alba x Populus x berolinensis]